jgi:C_GCAxxG_C_C family probable redox protein
MNKTEYAVATFNDGFNCAQAVLSAFAPELGLNRETALKIASGLGAGLGYQGKTCGAILGAYMVISLRTGSSMPNDELSKEITYNKTREFDKQFMKTHHSLLCKELLNTDLSTEEGYSYAVDNGLFENSCQTFVKDAVILLEQIISEL